MKEEKIKYLLHLVDDYLDGTITASAKKELEAEINKDLEFKKIVEEQIKARANIRIAGEKELKQKFLNKFDSLETKGDQPTTGQRSFSSYYFFAFILVVWIIGTLYFLDIMNTNPEPLDIAGVANIEDPSYDLFRSLDSSGMEISWDKAVQSFANKNYEETLVTLNGISVDSAFLRKHAGKFLLMKGVSFLKLEKYRESEKELLQIKTDNPYYDQVEWYLALNYFHSGQYRKANNKFASIKNNPTHYKRNEAAKYMDSLKSK